MITRRLAAGAIAAFAMTATLTTALATPAAAQAPSPSGEVGVLLDCGTYGENKSVTRAETLTRSATWLAVGGVPYSMDHCYSNQYGNYRTDCSGYVSMIWGLHKSLTTRDLHGVTHEIPRSQLRTGDALLTPGSPGHVALFIGWADAAKTQPRVREQAGGVGTVERVWNAAEAATYTPVRYDNIVETSSPPHTVDGSDLGGDGRADLVGIKSDGTMWYYGNGGTADGDPFNGGGTQIGSGFGVFNWVDGADLSGDGSADLVARKPDGTLWYYPNNYATNPGNVPFAGSGIQIGHGFQNFNHLDAADVTGDGRADLIARKPDGTLWYYGNGGTAGGDPFNGTGIQLGSGFGVFNWLDGADISGDGRADLIARKPDGTLWYYGNGGSNSDPFNGSGTQIGSSFDLFDTMNAADLSGDGSADMFARKPDGTLWYYPNNHATNPGGVPFAGSGIQIGHGFQSFVKLT